MLLLLLLYVALYVWFGVMTVLAGGVFCLLFGVTGVMEIIKLEARGNLHVHGDVAW